MAPKAEANHSGELNPIIPTPENGSNSSCRMKTKQINTCTYMYVHARTCTYMYVHVHCTCIILSSYKNSHNKKYYYYNLIILTME